MAHGSSGGWRSTSTLRLARPASAAAATELRHVLCAWLEALSVGAEHRVMIELACYEALANVACHAYTGRSAGMMELDATYEHASPGSPWVTATVCDHGRWQLPAAESGALRGRGVPMIRLLSGAVDIVGSDTGTTVRMSWDLSRTSALAS